MSKRGALALLCWVVAPATPFFFRPALTTLPRPPVRRHPRGLLAVESEPHSENAPAVDAAPETSLDPVDAECDAYWAKYADRWERPLTVLDVRAALEKRELSEGAPSVKVALERLERGEIQVRRRYRGLDARALRPRWRAVAARRARVQRGGGGASAWDAELARSEQERIAAEAVFTGQRAPPAAEGAEGAPGDAPGGAPGGALGAALGLALRTFMGNGTTAPALALMAAGENPEERWLTAALVDVFELELEQLRKEGERGAAREALARNGRDISWVKERLKLPPDELAKLSDDDALDAYMRSPEANAVPAAIFAAVALLLLGTTVWAVFSVIGTLAGGVASVAGIGGGGEASNLDSALDLLQ